VYVRRARLLLYYLISNLSTSQSIDARVVKLGDAKWVWLLSIKRQGG